MNKVERLIKDGWWFRNGVWVKDCPLCGKLRVHGIKCQCGIQQENKSNGKEKI